jgi:hypothetical protein
MDRTIELDSGPITYGDAVKSEINIINQFAYYEETKKLCKDLWEQRQSIEALTAHHLGLGQNGACIVQAQDTWLRGGFNICIPVEVEVGDVTKKVIFRCPMPHKLAEASYPGTVDEKIRCEVGTYAWMQENTPSVPIPHLFGFGFPDGRRHVRRFSCSSRSYCPSSKLIRLTSTLTQLTGHSTSGLRISFGATLLPSSDIHRFLDIHATRQPTVCRRDI